MPWVNASFKHKGKLHDGMSSSVPGTLEKAIQHMHEWIAKDYPGATDIVITEEPKNGGKPYLVDELIQRIHGDRPDISIEELKKYEWRILHTDRDSYREGGFWLSLPDAKKFLENEDNDYDDYVYLRRYGIVLFNIGSHTSHEIFMSTWNWIESVLLNDTTKTLEDFAWFDSNDYKDDAEKFLHNKYGIFMSRAFNMRLVHKSTNMKLNAAEKMVFGNIKFRELEPE